MDEDTGDEKCYAVSWYHYESADALYGVYSYLGEMSGDIGWNACMGYRNEWWNGDDDVREAQAAMESAAQQIASAVKYQVWNSRRGTQHIPSAEVGYRSDSKVTVVTNWGCTEGALWWGSPCPTQTYRQIKLNSLPQGVACVKVAVGGNMFTMRILSLHL